jgi:hypothetical protein
LRTDALACSLLAVLISVSPAGAFAEAAPDSADPVAAVHNPKAAEELERAFKKLESLKSYRLRATSVPPQSEPLIYEVQPPDRFRAVRQQKLAGFAGTSETVSVGDRIAFRFVSADLDAHLSKTNAAQDTSFMAAMSAELTRIVEDIASGAVWGLGLAAEQAASLAAAVREEAKRNPLEIYGKWQCMESPGPQDAHVEKPEAVAAETVEQLDATTLDGEKVFVYRSVSTFKNATDEGEATWSLSQQTSLHERTGLPSRVEMDDLTFDYFDFDAPLSIEFPSCDKHW